MLQIETRKYKITGLTPLLGGQPASPAVRTQYISSRAPSTDLGAEEDALMKDMEDKGITVFMRDEHDHLMLMDYMIKGFFKSALSALKQQCGVTNVKSKVDTLLFVTPRNIMILKDGRPVIEEDSQLERPLRASTMKGDRVALTASEQIDDPWSLSFEISLLPNAATARSKDLSWDAVEGALDYGRLCGIGQWRGGGYGRFTWKRIDDKE